MSLSRLSCIELEAIKLSNFQRRCTPHKCKRSHRRWSVAEPLEQRTRESANVRCWDWEFRSAGINFVSMDAHMQRRALLLSPQFYISSCSV